MIPAPFVFNAVIAEVVDGDTVLCTVDRGDRDYSSWPIRLAHCNARELSLPGGPEAKANLQSILPVGTKVVLYTLKPDKYAPRKDAAVGYLAADGTEHDLVTDLLRTGWVAAWDGRGVAPLPPWPRPEAVA